MERILTVFPSSANPLGPLCLDDAVENLSEFGVLGDHVQFCDRLGFPAGGPTPAPVSYTHLTLPTNSLV